MRTPLRTLSSALLVITLALAAVHGAAAADDPLPSWTDGAAKLAIVDFVQRVTTPGGQDFVPESERIATFDHDGTLWAEQPIYFQLAFAFDRVKALAPQHPEWQEQESFKSFLAGDLKGALAGGEKALVQLVMVSQAGMTTDEFEQSVKDWLAIAKHPRFNRLPSPSGGGEEGGNPEAREDGGTLCPRWPPSQPPPAGGRSTMLL
jgi:hypothetical protein